MVTVLLLYKFSHDYSSAARISSSVLSKCGRPYLVPDPRGKCFNWSVIREQFVLLTSTSVISLYRETGEPLC